MTDQGGQAPVPEHGFEVPVEKTLDTPPPDKTLDTPPADDHNDPVKDEEQGNQDEGDEEEEENETEALLPKGYALTELDKDIYSLIFTGDLKGPGFWFGISVAFFQGMLCWLVLYDLIDWDPDSTNPMRIPAGNDLVVMVAQALLLVFMSQDSMDMNEALVFLTDGYYPEVLQVCPTAQFWKWALSGITHLIVGLLLALDVFVLLMQETTVFGLGVDFVAMNKFFAVIDNKAFAIGGRGVCSVQLQQEIKNVSNVKVRTSTEYTWRKRIRDVVIVAAIMTGYGVLTYQMQHGFFLCKELFVQFGDVFNPGIVEISGPFDMLPLQYKRDGRAVYQERSTGQFMLAYCEKDKRWTMTPYLSGIFEPCGSSEVEVLARSGEDTGYDILKTVDTWVVTSVRHGMGFNPFVHFSMQCNECAKKCTKGAGVCNERNQCICKEGYYGVNCEFEQPCTEMTLSFATERFPAFLSEYPVPYDFAMITYNNTNVTAERPGTLQVEHRPVYFGVGPNANWIMAFLGRRWVIYGVSSDTGPSEVASRLAAANFSAVNTLFAPIYVSSPVDVGTPSDGPTPADVQWYKATRKSNRNPIETDTSAELLVDGVPRSYVTSWWVDENQPLDSRFVCAICNSEANPCKNFGTCNDATGICTCRKEVGALCEYEMKCTDLVGTDLGSFYGCPGNATCAPSGVCSGCPEGTTGNTCQANEEDL
ncbi:expressed unknown protein [Seminavis robusta]|uniref:EGF-like domain-containing protein n=1 Tax=Seminavis robusta TaxID=568900 RepID=A0A9N8DDY6_9STRA|nr:expressed unknown protein [Seminavis robusta]|eukprot:Sro49_g028650.1 n/a (704) ;mRNA; r:69463-71657